MHLCIMQDSVNHNPFSKAVKNQRCLEIISYFDDFILLEQQQME